MRAQALTRLNQFIESRVLEYADKRNYDCGPAQRNNISCLSPYIRNRVITEEEVVAAVLKRHPYAAVEKFIQEVFWRTYWKGWLEMRPQIWQRYRNDCKTLLVSWQDKQNYVQAINGTTGIACFDTWVSELKEHGYLHNHARMWFASIWVFTLQLPWQLGAHFFMRYLIDGDPASNTLSWRWVAGLHTRGKHYLARSSNIAKFTQNRFSEKITLNESAAPLNEDAALPECEWKPFSTDLPDIQEPYGILITDEDVSIPSSWIDKASSIVGIMPHALYESDQVAPSVIEHRKHCLSESISAHTANKHTIPIIEDALCEKAIAWAQQQKLQHIAMTQPCVGYWDTVMPQLQQSFASAAIKLHICRKPWDETLFPHARKGFFAFKKVIPEFVQNYV